MGKRAMCYAINISHAGVVREVAPNGMLSVLLDASEQVKLFAPQQCRLLKPRKKQSVEGYVSQELFVNPAKHDFWSLSVFDGNLGDHTVKVRIVRVKE